MLVSPLFPAPHVYLIDCDRQHPRGVGIRGLRHKPRHKIAATPLFRDGPTKSSEGGVVHSTPVLTCGGTGGLCKQDRERLLSRLVRDGERAHPMPPQTPLLVPCPVYKSD